MPSPDSGSGVSEPSNRACSFKEPDTLRYLGGDLYGRSQSGVDGITATLVLMRSSLALMSDRMTLRGGPHGSRPGSWENSSTQPHTINAQTLSRVHTVRPHLYIGLTHFSRRQIQVLFKIGFQHLTITVRNIKCILHQILLMSQHNII